MNLDQHRTAGASPLPVPEAWNLITESVIGAAIEVHSVLGPGLLERLYEEAMAVELRSRGLAFERQRLIRLAFKGQQRGDLKIDLVVENLVIVELKAIERVLDVHAAQLTSYLRSSDLPLGLLINFNHARLAEGITRRINPRSSRLAAN